MARLCFSSFINKYGKIVFPCFVLLCIIISFIPAIYDLDLWGAYSKSTLFPLSVFGSSLVSFTLKSVWKSNWEFISSIHNQANPQTWEEFWKPQHGFYAMSIIFTILLFIALISLISFLLIYYIKKKAIKPLLPVSIGCFLIINLLLSISTKCAPFIGFYLYIILFILALLYCFNFEHFPKRKERASRERKLSDKERIARLEQELEELKAKHNIEEDVN